MTEREWLESNSLLEMLAFLRGAVEPQEPESRSPFGPVADGEARRATRRQLARFAGACCAKWRELPLDEWSARLICAYEQFLAEDAAWLGFGAAYSQLSDAAKAGARPLAHVIPFWSLTPYGMAWLEQSLSWVSVGVREYAGA